MRDAAGRFVVGLDGPVLSDEERQEFTFLPPLGFILFRRNLVSAEQTVALAKDIRSLPGAPLLFVDQEGGTVDRVGPLLGSRFPAASAVVARGSDRVHEAAFLMGRAARLLGFDVDFAPVVDLGQPGAGAVMLEGRCYGVHAEDAVLAGTMFLGGLARGGVASCLKHFPGLGRGAVDSHLSLPVISAHEVDLMVTDVVPFRRLAASADGVMVGHAAYPGLTGDERPASLSHAVHALLRGACGFHGVSYSDDLNMGALGGSLPERCGRAAAAGCDVVVLSRPEGRYAECIGAVDADPGTPEEASRRIRDLGRRCREAPRPPFTPAAWAALRGEVEVFRENLAGEG